MKERVRFIIIDVLGFACIIGSVLLGWLPGPGGIPLLIIGLSLLANNHEWAERLLKKVKVEGLRIFEKIFDGSKKTKWIVDIISIVVITGAVLLVMSATRSVLKTAGISLLIAAIFMFLSNRRRYHKVLHKIKSPKHKH
jgi:hypothetical protein